MQFADKQSEAQFELALKRLQERWKSEEKVQSWKMFVIGFALGVITILGALFL